MSDVTIRKKASLIVAVAMVLVHLPAIASSAGGRIYHTIETPPFELIEGPDGQRIQVDGFGIIGEPIVEAGLQFQIGQSAQLIAAATTFGGDRNQSPQAIDYLLPINLKTDLGLQLRGFRYRW